MACSAFCCFLLSLLASSQRGFLGTNVASSSFLSPSSVLKIESLKKALRNLLCASSGVFFYPKTKGVLHGLPQCLPTLAPRCWCKMPSLCPQGRSWNPSAAEFLTCVTEFAKGTRPPPAFGCRLTRGVDSLLSAFDGPNAGGNGSPGSRSPWLHIVAFLFSLQGLSIKFGFSVESLRVDFSVRVHPVYT